ncbi:hypothetical protein MKW94_028738, partial [Papaver nudicaule]|nr:hypothetical protein [Papaver nudicaule]
LFQMQDYIVDNNVASTHRRNVVYGEVLRQTKTTKHCRLRHRIIHQHRKQKCNKPVT